MTTDPPQHTNAAAPQWPLEGVIRDLRHSRELTHKIRHHGCIRELPSREALTGILTGLSAALFPTHYGQTNLTDAGARGLAIATRTVPQMSMH